MKSKIVEAYGFDLLKSIPYKIGEFLESEDGEISEDIENEIKNSKWKWLKTVLFIYYKKDLYELSITTELHSDSYRTIIGFFKNQKLISGSNDNKTIFIKDKLFKRKLSRILVKNYFGSVYCVLSSKLTNKISHSNVYINHKSIHSDDMYVTESKEYDIKFYNIGKINRNRFDDHISVHLITFKTHNVKITYNNFTDEILNIQYINEGNEFKDIEFKITEDTIILKDYLSSINLRISVDGYVITNK